jgi:hypothetical protein
MNAHSQSREAAAPQTYTQDAATDGECLHWLFGSSTAAAPATARQEGHTASEQQYPRPEGSTAAGDRHAAQPAHNEDKAGSPNLSFEGRRVAGREGLLNVLSHAQGIPAATKRHVAWALDNTVLAAAVPVVECIWDHGSEERLKLCMERHFSAVRLAMMMASTLGLTDYDPLARN